MKKTLILTLTLMLIILSGCSNEGTQNKSAYDDLKSFSRGMSYRPGSQVLTAGGRWEANFEDYLYPINSQDIFCYKSTMTCSVASADVADGYLVSDVHFYDIQVFTDHYLEASIKTLCTDELLKIDIDQKKVELVNKPYDTNPDNPNCSSNGQEIKVLTLI